MYVSPTPVVSTDYPLLSPYSLCFRVFPLPYMFHISMICMFPLRICSPLRVCLHSICVPCSCNYVLSPSLPSLLHTCLSSVGLSPRPFNFLTIYVPPLVSCPHSKCVPLSVMRPFSGCVPCLCVTPPPLPPLPGMSPPPSPGVCPLSLLRVLRVQCIPLTIYVPPSMCVPTLCVS